MRPKVLVLGTGAIGGFYGGSLARVGARVSAVCRSDYEKVKAEGMQVMSTLGDFRFVPEKVIRKASEYGDVPDYVLVGLKVLPQIDTVSLIGPAVGPQTSIVLIQNGVEIEAPVAKAFPDNEIISGLAFIAVSRVGPGIIHHQAYGRLTIGCYPSGVSQSVQVLSELLNSAGVPCEATPDVVTARWRKLVWNAPFNPMSVLGGCVDTLTMLNSKESMRLVREVMKEVCALAEATGHRLPEGVIEQNIEGTLNMEAYKTSMLLDFEAGRPMEVEAILGNAVRAARRVGISVPRMETLYALLQLADRKSRP